MVLRTDFCKQERLFLSCCIPTIVGRGAKVYTVVAAIHIVAVNGSRLWHLFIFLKALYFMHVIPSIRSAASFHATQLGMRKSLLYDTISATRLNNCSGLSISFSGTSSIPKPFHCTQVSRGAIICSPLSSCSLSCCCSCFCCSIDCSLVVGLVLSWL